MLRKERPLLRLPKRRKTLACSEFSIDLRSVQNEGVRYEFLVFQSSRPSQTALSIYTLALQFMTRSQSSYLCTLGVPTEPLNQLTGRAIDNRPIPIRLFPPDRGMVCLINHWVAYGRLIQFLMRQKIQFCLSEFISCSSHPLSGTPFNCGSVSLL